MVAKAIARQQPRKQPQRTRISQLRKRAFPFLSCVFFQSSDIRWLKSRAGLLELASKQRMNTELRKKIFCTIMASEDYLDAFEKLLKLKLKAKQDREIVHVIVDCCLQEKTYNPFYEHLVMKLCQHSQNHKVTLQYSFWDQLKKSEKVPLRQALHLTRLIAFCISKFVISLAVLKVVEFDEISENNILLLRLLMVFLLTHHTEGGYCVCLHLLKTHMRDRVGKQRL
jgi:hypothetical protein